MRSEPCSPPSDTGELDPLPKEQNLYRRLRILEDEQKAHTTFDHRRSSTSRRTTISA